MRPIASPLLRYVAAIGVTALAVGLCAALTPLWGPHQRVLIVEDNDYAHGYSLPKEARQARKAGFDAHLVKPVHPDRLAVMLATRSREPDPSP